MDEVSYALTHGKTVVPVIYRKCKIPFRLQRVQYEDLSDNYEAGLSRVLARLGVVTPSSEISEANIAQKLAASSDHDGRAEDVTALSQTAPQEQKATPPTLKMRVLQLISVFIGLVLMAASIALLHRTLPVPMLQKIEKIEIQIMESLPKIIRFIK